MIGGPIGMYFLTVNTIFSGKYFSSLRPDLQCVLLFFFSVVVLTQSIYYPGNSTFAGATAAVTANVVLFAYIYVAWREDQGEQQARREKKGQ